MRAAGTTITAGELREALAGFGDNDPVRVEIAVEGVILPVTEVDGSFVQVDIGDTGLSLDAHNLLAELHEFRGTKKEMLAKIAGYVSYFAKNKGIEP